MLCLLPTKMNRNDLVEKRPTLVWQRFDCGQAWGGRFEHILRIPAPCITELAQLCLGFGSSLCAQGALPAATLTRGVVVFSGHTSRVFEAQMGKAKEGLWVLTFEVSSDPIASTQGRGAACIRCAEAAKKEFVRRRGGLCHFVMEEYFNVSGRLIRDQLELLRP